jgi:hypothetical protein
VPNLITRVIEQFLDRDTELSLITEIYSTSEASMAINKSKLAVIRVGLIKPGSFAPSV